MVEEKPWSDWSATSGKLKQKTGFDKDEVERIFTLCKDELTNFHGVKKTRRNAGASISRRFLSCHNLLLLGLHSLWKNPTDEDLADTFNTPRETIRDTKKRLFPIMQQCLQHFIQAPASPPRFEGGPLKDAFMVVDTTPTPIPQPPSKDDRKLYFNFKKKNQDMQ